VLNGAGDSGRRRFTSAHEIGHFVLHHEGCHPERGGVSEARRLAEREAVRKHGPEVARLADRFEVGRKAMLARLRSLGLAERHSEIQRDAADEDGPEKGPRSPQDP